MNEYQKFKKREESILRLIRSLDLYRSLFHDNPHELRGVSEKIIKAAEELRNKCEESWALKRFMESL